MIEFLKDKIQGKLNKGQRRSPLWRSFRNDFLKSNPVCQICGSKKKLVVHHVIPVHVDASKELDNDNLITLCHGNNRYGIKSCHLLFGHFGNFRKYNEDIRQDADDFSFILQDKE